MTNVVPFAIQYDEFEDMSVSERRILIESWNEDMNENLERIRDSAAKIAELIEANKRANA